MGPTPSKFRAYLDPSHRREKPRKTAKTMDVAWNTGTEVEQRVEHLDGTPGLNERGLVQNSPKNRYLGQHGLGRGCALAPLVATLANKHITAPASFDPEDDFSTFNPQPKLSNSAIAARAQATRAKRAAAQPSRAPTAPTAGFDIPSPIEASTKKLVINGTPKKSGAGSITFTALEACELSLGIADRDSVFDIVSPRLAIPLAKGEAFTAIVRFQPSGRGTYTSSLTALCTPDRAGSESLQLETTLNVEVVGNAEASAEDTKEEPRAQPRSAKRRVKRVKKPKKENRSQALEIAEDLLEPPVDLGTEHVTKEAALGAIHDKLGAVFSAGKDGVDAAKGAIEELPPPSQPELVEKLLDIAVGVLIASTAGAIGASAARFLKSKRPELAQTTAPDAFKDGIKDLYKGGAKRASMGRTNGEGSITQAAANGVAEETARARGEDGRSSVMQRMPKTYFFAQQQRALTSAKARSGDNFARVRSDLEKLDLETLNRVNATLQNWIDRGIVEETQTRNTIAEWINFRARLRYGAPADSTRDAALSGLSPRELDKAQAVLHVRGRLDLASGPTAETFSFPGINPIAASLLDRQALGQVKVNKIVHLKFDDRHIGLRFVWKPDSSSIDLDALDPWTKDVLIAYALGQIEVPPNPGYSSSAFGHQLISLFDIHGPEKVAEGAREIMSDLADTPIKGPR